MYILIVISIELICYIGYKSYRYMIYKYIELKAFNLVFYYIYIPIYTGLTVYSVK